MATEHHCNVIVRLPRPIPETSPPFFLSRSALETIRGVTSSLPRSKASLPLGCRLAYVTLEPDRMWCYAKVPTPATQLPVADKFLRNVARILKATPPDQLGLKAR